MDFKIIGVANFRSFDEDGVVFDKPGKINLIIGKNNSGKSNFLRFLRILANEAKTLEGFPCKDIENQFRRNGKNTTLIVGFDPGEIFSEDQVRQYFKDIEEVIAYVDLLKGQILRCTSLEDFDKNILHNLQKKYSSANKDLYLEEIYKGIYNQLRSKISKYTRIVYIPHFRKVESNSTTQTKSNVIQVSGNDVIDRLFQMQHPSLGSEKERKKFDLIRTYISDLIDEPDLKIEIPHNKDRIILELHGNRLSLDALGTGIEELVIMCMAIAIYEDHLVCIEEPEIHMHPELQRKFLEFITKTKNTYFITTHSNIFLDYKSSVNIYHVKYDKNRSEVVHANTNEHSYEILNDLAYKASDLLQSNGVIWVEGPSDRIYLKRWLELVNKDFKEGIHYSIMFYGGRLLSHLSAESEFFEEELIPLLKINRNAIVMIDRDGTMSNNKLNETKRRINFETNIENCWITKGREIENYITERTIKTYFKEEREKEIKFKFRINEKIGKLINNQNKGLNFKYDKDKVGYAKKIVNYITDKDLEILDLKRKLNHLNKEILKWNNMSEN